MTEQNSAFLTPEQEALISTYQEKWRSLELKKGPIDRERAAAAVKAAYAAIGAEEPKILFYDSPSAALDEIASYLTGQVVWSPELFKEILGWEMLGKLQLTLHNQVEDSLGKKLGSPLYSKIYRERNFRSLFEHIWRTLREQWHKFGSGPDDKVVGAIETAFSPYMSANFWTIGGCYFDFCLEVLHGEVDRNLWEAFQNVVSSCGWIFAFRDKCYICDRPHRVNLDDQGHLHGIEKPALEYADGWKLYFYEDIVLPEKYGGLSPDKWSVQWLMEEKNAELRRVLIEGIGYDRISEELRAKELDAWREYSLLSIRGIDVNLLNPIYLLKMICPSTGQVHALRVPPEVNSAREAIRWVNWGLDPEEFAIQT